MKKNIEKYSEKKYWKNQLKNIVRTSKQFVFLKFWVQQWKLYWEFYPNIE